MGEQHDRSAEKLQRTLPPAGRDEPQNTPEQRQLAEQVQDGLSRLRGIREARVRAVGGRVEATVLALPERSEEDTVSDVRVLAQQAGVDVGTLRIRVMGARRHGDKLPRRKLSSLSTKRYGERFTAQVTLEMEGDALIGEVDVPTGRRFEHRSVARATLNSVSVLIPYPLQLEHVEILGFGADRLAVVSISSRDDSLVGSAFVRGDELDAIARATLDAINRVLNLSSVDLARLAQEPAASRV